MATRLYGVATTAAPVSPAFTLQASWTATTGAVRRSLSTSKAATTESRTNVAITSGANNNALAFQLISDTLDVNQTIAGTVSIITRGRELATQDNIGARVRKIVVIDAAGALRGTLLALGAHSVTTELGQVVAGYPAAASASLSSVNALAGDRIVVELGYGMTTTGTTPLYDMVIGGNGTDHGTGEGDATGTVPWIEFSQNITFGTPPVVPISEYGFNEGSGTTAADSAPGTAYNLTASHATNSWSATGKNGAGAKSPQYSGAMGPNTALTNYTVMFWARRDGTHTGFAGLITDNTGSFFIEVDAGASYRPNIWTGTSPVNAATAMALGTWEHWAFVVSGSTATIYRNAVSDASGAFGSSQNFGGSDNRVLTNSGVHGEAGPFNGVIDELRVFDQALSPAQITTWMNTAIGGTTSVSSDLDVRWTTRGRVTSDHDLRWRTKTQVSSDHDLRWATKTPVQADHDLRWRTLTQVTSDLDVRWETIETGGVDYRIFSSSPPSIAPDGDTASVNLGIEFTITAACSITALHYLQPNAAGTLNQRTLALYDMSTGLVVSGTQGNVTPVGYGVWMTVPVSPPVALTIGRTYRAIVFHPAGRYGATGNYFLPTGSGGTGPGKDGLVSGPISVPSAADAIANDQGSYKYNATLALTDAAFNDTNYWVDVTVRTPGGSTPISSDLDLRWVTRSQVVSDLDVRWRTRVAVASDHDVRWRTLVPVSADHDIRWRTLTRLTSDLDVRWRTAGIVTSDLDVRWRTLNAVSADHDVRWRTLTAVTRDHDLRWVTRGQVNSDADLRWTTRAQVVSDLDLQWRTRVAVDSDHDVRWRTRQIVSADHDIRWATKVSISADHDLRWRTLNAVTRDHDLRWITRTQVTSDHDLRWVTISTGLQVSSDLDLRWVTRGRVTSDLDVRWRTLQTISSDHDVRWRTLNAVTKDHDLRWITRAQISADHDLRWRTLSSITADHDIRWRTLARLTADHDVRWRTLTQITASDLDLRWRTLTPITSDHDLRWRTLQSVFGDHDLRWITSGPSGTVSSDLDLRWRTRQTVAFDHDIRWRTLVAITPATHDLRWRTLQLVTRDHDLRWKTSGLVSSDLDLRWRTREAIASDLDVRWRTLVRVSVDHDLRWRVLQAVFRDHDLRWTTRGGVISDLELHWITAAGFPISGEVTIETGTGAYSAITADGRYSAGSGSERYAISTTPNEHDVETEPGRYRVIVG